MPHSLLLEMNMLHIISLKPKLTVGLSNYINVNDINKI